MALTTIVAVIVGSGAVVAALYAIGKHFILPIWRFIVKTDKMMNDVETIPQLHDNIKCIKQSIDRLEPLVVSMHQEMHPDHGGSMKDQVTRIEDALGNHMSDSELHTTQS